MMGTTPSNNKTSLLTRAGTAILRTRWLMRAPIWLFRAGMGPLFGSRLLMLEHTGRKSGKRRYVVLEVLDRPGPGQFVVSSGFGRRSQWFQNVTANTHVRVWSGNRRGVRATANLVDPNDVAAILHRYDAQHSRSWAILHPMFEQTLGRQFGEHNPVIPMIRFECQASSTPPSGPASLGAVEEIG